MEELNMEAAWYQGKTCGCGHELAQAYVPFQTFKQLYSPEEGLIKGTIFPELYHPYEKKCKNESMRLKNIYKMEGEQ